MSNYESVSIGSDHELFDKLVCGSLSPDEFKNNAVIIENFSNTVDQIRKMGSGYALITVDIRTTRNIIIVSKDDSASYYMYRIYSATKTIPIESPVSFKVHELREDIDLRALLTRTSELLPYTIGEKEILDTLVTDTLDGYRINQHKIDPIVDMIAKNNSQEFSNRSEFATYNAEDILELYDSLYETVSTAKNKLRQKLNKFIDGLKCPELHGEIVIGGISNAAEMSSASRQNICQIFKINDVKEIGGQRFASITSYLFYTTRTKIISCDVETTINRYKPTSSGYSLTVSNGKCYTASYNGYSTSWVKDNLGYNYVDKGRILIGVGYMGKMNTLLVGNDPRIDSEYKEHLSEEIAELVDNSIKENIGVGQYKIVDTKNKDAVTDMNLLRITKKDFMSTQHFMQSIKMLTDEYKYVVKRQKAEGSDVKITDNIIYNHTEAKLIYNDFSLKVDDEQIRSDIYTRCSELSVAFYRGTKTEQDIIDELLKEIFSKLTRRIEGWYSGAFPIHMVFNNVVDINITREGKNNFTYINEQRFNKNEIVPIIKEITCYRDQETANKFIETISKLGLSVYMGITSGYELNSRIYRFKKNKGRSNFTLVIDDVEIDISGKAIVNTLYEMSTGRTWTNIKQLDERIFKAAKSGYDYVKYKFLIDSSYKVFMEKSKQFLKEKIEQIGGTEVIYIDGARRKELAGIKITGLSGKTYIVAYDTKESFVFMNPTDTGIVRGTPEQAVYEKGNYICMIDQSSIKSNIGYDTVISKIMSLKNDSIVASRIYNLEEELNK